MNRFNRRNDQGSYDYEDQSDSHSAQSSSDDSEYYRADSNASEGSNERGENQVSGQEDSAWPKRLLHVRTMTSYPRSGYATYNGVTEPKYNIMSYTWGRYEDRSHRTRNRAPGITIKGGAWDIPIIDTTRQDNGRGGQIKPFRVEEFEHVLRVVGAGVEFVWVDVACIDQNPLSPDKADQIGKQASIFQLASHAFVWLWEHDEQSLNQCMTDFSYVVDKLAHSNRAPSAQLAHKANNAIIQFFDDAWFSSLWTLQEAFLRKDAILLSRSGQKGPSTLAPGSQRPDNCVHLVDATWLPKLWIAEHSSSCDPRALKAIKASGFRELISANSLGLFGMASKRTTRHECDRVYGIEQIYDFKLGNTKPAFHGPDPVVDELLNELGAALNQKFPIFAQMFVHTTDVRDDNRWRIDQNVVVPTIFYSPREVHVPQIPGLRAYGSNERGSEDQMEVIFEGPVLPLGDLVKGWENSQSFSEEERTGEAPPQSLSDEEDDAQYGPPDPKTATHDLNYLRHSIYLDEGPWMDDIPSVHARSEMAMDSDRPLQIGRDLLSMEDGYDWQILILGKLSRQVNYTTNTSESWAGILVFAIDDDNWRRAGICTWMGNDMQIDMASILDDRYDLFYLV
ncbi:hypothetical protein LSUB1_G006093 [Lachnellula subtilissima]|uniref:Heterokaryon incompatibility domain-containing protein n=1 Tax=Lachnellula subtilissima TaxID=602034 RepID=A0A8H8RNT4_9HELO|nr:hypothetical protein LSUB1_G006093 [Lachnellula subtilissima]